MPGPSKLVAIVVPIYRTELDATEKVALRALDRHLGHYDRFIVHPIGLTLPPELDGMATLPLSPRRFRGIGAYSAMLMSPDFYRRFSDYRYVLIYQTDCLVFHDTLAGWCESGFSYIGAPWLRKDRDRKRRRYLAVGNGGLSLRHVGDHLRVLQAMRLQLTGKSDQSRRFFHSWRQGKRLLAHWLRSRFSRRPAAHIVRRYFDQAEDMFWAYYAPLLDENYTVAPVETALRFARERSAEGDFPKTRADLPFGAHGWHKIDTERWLAFIDADDAALLQAAPTEDAAA
ncbi:MAG: DUF5672 family protein [Oceanibaculum nanhaiense]|uniref:DUF5672 family protein n=1 Tax=Oceanibaculum nanhaiense TaxID=1909734 RepID=UPI0025A38E41|nr:DUF5672 family protein [Oceanibaculum nanhaiense]MDM7944705.1 DUF5672 family protein [Oceanibaculum nanhaiense]